MQDLQDINDCRNAKIDKAAHVEGVLVTYGGSVYPAV